MKKKKLVIGAALAAAALIGLASCGDETTAPAAPQNSQVTPTNTTPKDTTPVVVKYKIVFETNGGTIVDEVEAEAGEAFTVINPIKSGYTFAGWYKDADLTEEWSGNVMPKGGATLYAKWSKNKGPDAIVPTYIDNYYSFVGDFKTELTITDDNYQDIADMMGLPAGTSKDEVISMMTAFINSGSWSYSFYFKSETELYDSSYDYSSAAELESDVTKNGLHRFTKQEYTIGTDNVINFVSPTDYLADGVWSVSSDNKYLIWDMGFMKVYFGVVIID